MVVAWLGVLACPVVLLMRKNSTVIRCPAMGLPNNALQSLNRFAELPLIDTTPIFRSLFFTNILDGIMLGVALYIALKPAGVVAMSIVAESAGLPAAAAILTSVALGKDTGVGGTLIADCPALARLLFRLTYNACPERKWVFPNTSCTGKLGVAAIHALR